MKTELITRPRPQDVFNKKKIVYTRARSRKPTNPAPKKPPPQNGLRIRLLQPERGATLKTAPWRIAVQDAYMSPKRGIVEQLGVYDTTPRWFRRPAPNLLDDGEFVFQKRLEWNAERLKYWIGMGARPTPRVVWLMQLTGISLDPAEHQATMRRQAEAAKHSSMRKGMSSEGSSKDLTSHPPIPPATEYRPDVFVPNDPKQQERLEMRAQSKHYRNVALEPGSKEWVEAQMLRPSMQDDKEFEAAQMEPYPLVPPGLQRRQDLEPSRYARSLPLWIAQASQEQMEGRARKLKRLDIEKPSTQPYTRVRKYRWATTPAVEQNIPPLEMPPESDLTRAMQELDVGGAASGRTEQNAS